MQFVFRQPYLFVMHAAMIALGLVSAQAAFRHGGEGVDRMLCRGEVSRMACRLPSCSVQKQRPALTNSQIERISGNFGKAPSAQIPCPLLLYVIQVARAREACLTLVCPNLGICPGRTEGACRMCNLADLTGRLITDEKMTARCCSAALLVTWSVADKLRHQLSSGFWPFGGPPLRYGCVHRTSSYRPQVFGVYYSLMQSYLRHGWTCTAHAIRRVAQTVCSAALATLSC